MRDRAVANSHNVIDSATLGPSRVETEAGEESEEDYDAGIMTPEPTPKRSSTPTSVNSKSNTPPNRAASPTNRTSLTDMTDTVAIKTTIQDHYASWQDYYISWQDHHTSR